MALPHSLYPFINLVHSLSHLFSLRLLLLMISDVWNNMEQLSLSLVSYLLVSVFYLTLELPPFLHKENI